MQVIVSRDDISHADNEGLNRVFEFPENTSPAEVLSGICRSGFLAFASDVQWICAAPHPIAIITRHDNEWAAEFVWGTEQFRNDTTAFCWRYLKKENHMPKLHFFASRDKDLPSLISAIKQVSPYIVIERH